MTGEEAAGHGPCALVERLFDAFAARDVDALLDVMDPEIEFFGPTATVLNEGKCYRGHDGMRRYFNDADALWAELELEPVKYREVGNHVVVLGRVRARARDGLELDTPAAWVWRVAGDKIVWGSAYGDREAMPRSLQEGGRGPYGGPDESPRRALGDPAAIQPERSD
jgi:ketosteroid isomerase-like protein